MYETIKLFIENLKISNYAENTLVSYEIHLRNYYSYCKQFEVNYRTISVKELFNYRQMISKTYSISSINAKLSVISSFYNFLIDIEETEKNPIRRSMYVRRKEISPKPLSIPDKTLFLNYIESKAIHTRLGFQLMFDTGIRITELTKLKADDVRLIDNKVFLYIRNSKNKKSRLVPIFSKQIALDLLDYLEGNYQGKLFFFTARSFQLHAEEFSRKFDIKFTTHMARHTFATEKISQGMELDVLKEILGHADIRTTMYYVLTDENKILDMGVTI